MHNDFNVISISSHDNLKHGLYISLIILGQKNENHEPDTYEY
jgi:hypothetical protein